jgi:hypothetical protein
MSDCSSKSSLETASDRGGAARQVRLWASTARSDLVVVSTERSPKARLAGWIRLEPMRFQARETFWRDDMRICQRIRP